MSNQNFGPEFNSPLSERADRLQLAYTAYFDGLILGDPTDLEWAAAQLDGHAGYLSKRVVGHATNLATVTRMNGGRFQEEHIDEALCDGIRAYEYADTPFNHRLVLSAVERFEMDAAWLMEIVKPSKHVLNDILEAKSRAERKVYKQRGRQALGSLGVSGRFRKKLRY